MACQRVVIIAVFLGDSIFGSNLVTEYTEIQNHYLRATFSCHFCLWSLHAFVHWRPSPHALSMVYHAAKVRSVGIAFFKL
jgi:hypothetical protein